MIKRKKVIPILLMMNLIWIPNLSFANKYPSYSKELSCMTEAIFKEANTESREGQIAVAHVVMNRVKNKEKRFPNTICEVVNHADFTYTNKKNIRYEELSKLAHGVITGQIKDNTNGSTHFHHVNVKPSWRKQYIFKTRIGKHIFYRYNYKEFQ